MNPFTRFLKQWLPDRDLDAFVEHWDGLEALVIRVYKAGAATAADEATFADLHGWLQQAYPRWAAALAEHWRATRVAGQPAAADPFARLLGAQRAADYVGDWAAMQHLPAAREALNRYIQAQTPAS